MKLRDRAIAALGLRKQGEVAVSAVVIRKDGTREDLGTIARGKLNFGTELNKEAPDGEGR